LAAETDVQTRPLPKSNSEHNPQPVQSHSLRGIPTSCLPKDFLTKIYCMFQVLSTDTYTAVRIFVCWPALHKLQDKLQITAHKLSTSAYYYIQR